MQINVPTDRKKTVASVFKMATRLFTLLRATWMPSTIVNASSTRVAMTTHTAASVFL